MYSSQDIKGVLRGQCHASNCECDGYSRALDNCSQPAALHQATWCVYCGHSPVQHARISIFEDESCDLSDNMQGSTSQGASISSSEVMNNSTCTAAEILLERRLR
ncbi:uncharacterized protein LOC121047923 [Ixodes scapularis]|uniref:uncharacterized protein LOC121047923 n=1 Tax=Ixodes scapularis TaxID=6945 RepID=UPI001AD749F1|nr:uncharacterized protein LOC121047923 [Ixodes scapularis]